jgi:hypothetical protein
MPLDNNGNVAAGFNGATPNGNVAMQNADENQDMEVDNQGLDG